MTRIDLLPWREERRKRRTQEFQMVLVIVALLAVGVVYLIHQHFNGLIADQEARNNFLREEIRKVEQKIKEIERLEALREQVTARIRVIDELQSRRWQMVRVFDELVRTITDGVRLTNIKQNGDVLTLEGLAQSNQAVSAYMSRLERSQWLTSPELRIIQVQRTDPFAPFQFSLTVKLGNPEAQKEEERGAAGQSGASAAQMGASP
ncbi:MAG: fimbrial protein [Lysobacterales bacterium]|jgi:type IV pilus assembly protein PilN|nr:MAG: fimbrial protein [Xanthomonadales bacterium]